MTHQQAARALGSSVDPDDQEIDSGSDDEESATGIGMEVEAASAVHSQVYTQCSMCNCTCTCMHMCCTVGYFMWDTTVFILLVVKVHVLVSKISVYESYDRCFHTCAHLHVLP